MMASGGACEGLRSQTACLADGLGAPTTVVVGVGVSRGKEKARCRCGNCTMDAKGLQSVAELRQAPGGAEELDRGHPRYHATIRRTTVGVQ